VASGQWSVITVFLFFLLVTGHWSLVTVSIASAFSIGSIEVKSSLNEGFLAEIPLYVDGQDGLQVSIGNESDYARLGIERNKIVDTLSLSFEPIDKDRVIIKLSSLKPINHPSFNLIIKAEQNGGTILENYFLAIDFQKSLSLNLPSTDENAKTEENIIPPSPSLTKGDEGVVMEEIIQKPASESSAKAESERQTTTAAPSPKLKIFTVKNGNSLYRIAKRLQAMAKESVRQAQSTLDQIVVAIWQKNRDKFINENMNELKKNTTLDIENINDSASAIPVAEAKKVVYEHWREWKNRKKGEGKIEVAELADDTKTTEYPFQIESLKGGDAIRQTIMDWKKEWESEDIEKYMSHYSDRFASNGYNLSSWKEHKNNFNKRHSDIEISIDNIQIRKEGNLLIASFLQRFKSDKMESSGTKLLYFEDKNGEWKIKGEKWNKYTEKNIQNTHPYVIHLSSFRDRESALKEINYFRKKGYSAYDVSFKLPEKGVWYRVLIDRFSSKGEAKEFAKGIIKDGHADYINELELPYAIETGIFESNEDAIKELLRLRDMGYSPYPLLVCSSDKCSYQTLIGAYADPTDANPITEELNSKGIQNKIVQP
jgi:ketosteroid isomerase-like protein